MTRRPFGLERYDRSGGETVPEPMSLLTTADTRLIGVVHLPADDVVLALVEGPDEETVAGDRRRRLAGRSTQPSGLGLPAGSGDGIATMSITTSSKMAGETTFDYQRTQAELQYDRVTDVAKGDKAYLAVKEIGAEAVVVSDAGSLLDTILG